MNPARRLSTYLSLSRRRALTSLSTSHNVHPRRFNSSLAQHTQPDTPTHPLSQHKPLHVPHEGQYSAADLAHGSDPCVYRSLDPVSTIPQVGRSRHPPQRCPPDTHHPEAAGPARRTEHVQPPDHPRPRVRLPRASPPLPPPNLHLLTHPRYPASSPAPRPPPPRPQPPRAACTSTATSAPARPCSWTSSTTPSRPPSPASAACTSTRS